MQKVSENRGFNEETRVLFSRLYKREITDGEAEEIKSNFFRLIEVLRDIDKGQEV